MLVLVFVLIDITWTVLSVTKHGFLPVLVALVVRFFTITLPRRISDAVYHIKSLLTKRPEDSLQKRTTHPLTRYMYTLSGPVALLSTLGTWIVLFLFGWTMVYFFTADNLVFSSTGDFVPSSGQGAFASRLYFVAIVSTTVGFGDIVPVNNPWRVVVVINAYSGVMFTALIIAYILAVVPAVLAVRKTLTILACYGSTPVGILRTAWNGSDCKALESVFESVLAELCETVENVRIYPVMLCYRSFTLDMTAILRIAAIDELITILHYAIKRDVSHLDLEQILPSPLILTATKRSITLLLFSLNKRINLSKKSGTPPGPSLSREEVEWLAARPSPFCRQLGKGGIPAELFDLDAYHVALEKPKLVTRRRLLKASVISAGYQWEDLFQSEYQRHVLEASAAIMRSSTEEQEELDLEQEEEAVRLKK